MDDPRPAPQSIAFQATWEARQSGAPIDIDAYDRRYFELHDATRPHPGRPGDVVPAIDPDLLAIAIQLGQTADPPMFLGQPSRLERLRDHINTHLQINPLEAFHAAIRTEAAVNARITLAHRFEAATEDWYFALASPAATLPLEVYPLGDGKFTISFPSEQIVRETLIAADRDFPGTSDEASAGAPIFLGRTQPVHPAVLLYAASLIPDDDGVWPRRAVDLHDILLDHLGYVRETTGYALAYRLHALNKLWNRSRPLRAAYEPNRWIYPLYRAAATCRLTGFDLGAPDMLTCRFAAKDFHALHATAPHLQ
jgi:hypothetical protein